MTKTRNLRGVLQLLDRNHTHSTLQSLNYGSIIPIGSKFGRAFRPYVLDYPVGTNSDAPGSCRTRRTLLTGSGASSLSACPTAPSLPSSQSELPCLRGLHPAQLGTYRRTCHPNRQIPRYVPTCATATMPVRADSKVMARPPKTLRMMLKIVRIPPFLLHLPHNLLGSVIAAFFTIPFPAIQRGITRIISLHKRTPSAHQKVARLTVDLQARQAD